MFALSDELELPSLGLLDEEQCPPKFGTYYGTIRKGIHAAVWDGLDGKYTCNVYTHDKSNWRNCYECDRLIPAQELGEFDDPVAVLAHIHHIVQKYDKYRATLTHGGIKREDA